MYTLSPPTILPNELSMQCLWINPFMLLNSLILDGHIYIWRFYGDFNEK